MAEKTLFLGELHYHFRRCGVQTVIETILHALIAHGPYDRIELDLISSDAGRIPGRELAEAVRRYAAGHPLTVQVRPVELPELGYRADPASNRQTFLIESADLAERLLNVLRPDRLKPNNPYVLHAHNANLGKNPRLTMALKLLAGRLAKDDLPAWILHHMHDFAEDQRPACWSALRDISGRSDASLALEMMYPRSSRVVWACINTRDRDRLLSIGLEPQTVFVLPNAVDTDAFSSPPLTRMNPPELAELDLAPRDFAADLKGRIADYARRNRFRFEPDRKILLAPIKAIRRKNVLESLLLLLALNWRRDEYQLLITLPPASPEDCRYADRMVTFLRRYRLPAVLGFGREILTSNDRPTVADGRVVRFRLVDMLHLSAAVVTTSLQEGFGYVFHESWLAHKAVLGRDIPAVTRDFAGQGLKLDHLYQSLLVPLAWLETEWPAIQQAYIAKITSLRAAAGLGGHSRQELIAQIHRHKVKRIDSPQGDPAEYLDWADLPEETQFNILHILMEDNSRIAHLYPLDRSGRRLADWYEPPLPDIIIEWNRKAVIGRYGLTNLAERLGCILSIGGRFCRQHAHRPAARPIANQPVFAQSLDASQVRLLF
ncbi:MAG: hypothetical protein JW810_07600 [Sedimentisphaerales bacterium]|nr:hypothetical protein [Sedimentisphaerales bacterium]